MINGRHRNDTRDFVVVICDYTLETLEEVEDYLKENKPDLPLEIVQPAWDTWTGIYLKKHEGFFSQEEADRVLLELNKAPSPLYTEIVEWCHGVKEQSVK